ncbi:hypothetical protein [Melittangium boletus]|uniref:hypothetical protein n=1 Tax=Melittangium boletus TaxID=83453 RepID=UPI003DA69764
MGTPNKKNVRRLAEAVLAVVRYGSTRSAEVEAVLLSSLAGEIQEQSDLDESAASSEAERLAQVASKHYDQWLHPTL